MSQVAPSAQPSHEQSFAAHLIEQAATGTRKPPVSEKPPHWMPDPLADDIATISYEQALRAHARNAPIPNHAPDFLGNPNSPVPNPVRQAIPSSSAQASDLRARRNPLYPTHEARRTASITIRLSRHECEQIHTRAEQAGLTVSAYLRSCVLEVEDLRAQVRQMIAEMRTAQTPSTAEPTLKEQATKRTSPWKSILGWFRLRSATHA